MDWILRDLFVNAAVESLVILIGYNYIGRKTFIHVFKHLPLQYNRGFISVRSVTQWSIIQGGHEFEICWNTSSESVNTEKKKKVILKQISNRRGSRLSFLSTGL